MSQGVVKWFNAVKGYGFIRSAEDEDIFVHFSVIHSEGFRSLKEGQVVQLDFERGPKGLHATNVEPTPAP
ncbi:MAG: cold-shock protein [Armatimonadetes bacterium]|nr:cold-shock protein [Armatimonadota bacterium]